MAEITVISLGGSVVAPATGPDVDYLKKLVALLRRAAKGGRRMVLVIGGGAAARQYIGAARSVESRTTLAELDRLGIAATRLNAELVRVALGPLAEPAVVADPTVVSRLKRPILVAGGWKPGRSTDAVAVELACRLGTKTVINLSNIAWVYDADPRQNPQAKPIPRLTWSEFRRRFGGPWRPGKNAPFDPVAARAAAKGDLRVIVADGRDLKNLVRLLDGKEGEGTVIGNR
jgi:uridylate kinase